MPSLMCFKSTPDLLLRGSSLEVNDRLQALLRREDLDLTLSLRISSLQRKLSSFVASLILNDLRISPAEVCQGSVAVPVLVLLRENEQTVLDTLDSVLNSRRSLIVSQTKLPL